MLSNSVKTEEKPVSLKDRMKFFEAAAEAERNKPSPKPVPFRRQSSGSSSAQSPIQFVRKSSGSSSSALESPTQFVRTPTGAGLCTRVSLTRTVSGESVVREVVSPISLPTRSRIAEEEGDCPLATLNKCRFSEVRRESAEVRSAVNACFQPVENRAKKVSRDTDRDSGVSCSSDDQDRDQILSDTETEPSVDSAVFANLDKQSEDPLEHATKADHVTTEADHVTTEVDHVTSVEDLGNAVEDTETEEAEIEVDGKSETSEMVSTVFRACFSSSHRVIR